MNKNKSHSFEPFNIRNLDDLRDEALRLNLDLPLASDLSMLQEPLTIGGRFAPNRMCVQPMECCDASSEGAPGELTLRRYRRLAEGGFGVIWMEATAVEDRGRSSPHQLWLNSRNVGAFAGLVKSIREGARKRWAHEIVLVLQLAHAGRFSCPAGVADPVIVHHDAIFDSLHNVAPHRAVISDDELDSLAQKFVEISALAAEAGFDGVDIKSCNGCLLSDLLDATERSGRYGGALENRSRFLRTVIGELRDSDLDIFPATRISPPLSATEPDQQIELARSLENAGVQLLSIAAPVDLSERVEREHPLTRFMRVIDITRTIQQAVPDIPVVAGRLSWCRQFIPNVAAGLLSSGCATLAGIGRAALADPGLAGDLLDHGELDPQHCCIACDGCVQLLRDGGHAGCVVMDAEIYGGEYRNHRYFSLDNLRSEARRCRGCEPAPCRAGCPTRIDIPAFLSAFADGEMEQAYEILRVANALPGMCSILCPVDMLCEGRCVAGTFDGRPIPIHDIQFAVYQDAFQRGSTGVRLPEKGSGKRVAVVGAGPAGVACAITLLEQGHNVVLFERSSRLGGTPELAIRSTRFSGAHDEVAAILKPALPAARLTIKYGVELGRDFALGALRDAHDAVFLAMGVWGERSIGDAAGVVSGLNFLTGVKAGTIRAVPERVILLAGGDSAMDCAKVAFEIGARELLIVYAGALSEMHWHMRDSWFRTEGVHLLTMNQPLCYCVDSDGKVKGLKVKNLLTATEAVIATTFVIEAMGLGIEPSLTAALTGCEFTGAGLIKTADGGSLACGLPGVFAGGGLINGGDAVVQCVAEGMRAGLEINEFLKH